jgi:multidrug efflux pump
MVTATILAIFYIPLFFVLVRTGFHGAFAAVRAHFRGRQEART